jgi:hypothetical protein
MKLKAIEDGFNKEAIQSIKVQPDRSYFKSTLWLFLLIILGVGFLTCYFLGDKLLWLIPAIFFLTVAFIYLFYLSFKFTRANISKGEEYAFTKYFWDLVFPFIILMMAGVFLITWFLLIEKLSAWESGILTGFAGFACFWPCYIYKAHVVSKAVIKHTFPAPSALVRLMQQTISLLKHEKKLQPERKKAITDLLEKLLAELQDLLKEIPEKN